MQTYLNWPFVPPKKWIDPPPLTHFCSATSTSLRDVMEELNKGLPLVCMGVCTCGDLCAICSAPQKLQNEGLWLLHVFTTEFQMCGKSCLFLSL